MAKAYFSNCTTRIMLKYTNEQGGREKRFFESVSDMMNFCVKHNIELHVGDCETGWI